MMPFLQRATLVIALAMLGACSGGGGGNDGSGTSPPAAIVVNSLLDSAAPPTGTVTLRSALATAASGQAIEFDGTLNGGTIALSIVADEHTRLKGEVMGIRDEPSGPVSYLVGWFDRDEAAARGCFRFEVDVAEVDGGGHFSPWRGGGRSGGDFWGRNLG